MRAHPLLACLRQARKGRVLQGFGACGTGLRPPFHPLARQFGKTEATKPGQG